jgi:uncharacterized protein
MRIVVLSDTHVESGMGKLPPQIYKALNDADLIIHAGDIVSLDVVTELKGYAPVEAVSGNMDPWSVAGTLPNVKVIEVEGYRIGIAHGIGAPAGLAERVQAHFPPGTVDVIVFGHSHQPMVEQRGDVLFVNPGSPTDKRWAPYNSYAIIKIDGDISAEIVRL